MHDPIAVSEIAPEYLTTDQVSQLCGFSVKALETLRHKRKGPTYLRVGHRIRYKRADVIAWLELERVACTN